MQGSLINRGQCYNYSVDNIIDGRPDLIQFAKDGKYEEAWKIPLDGRRPQDPEIEQYLTTGSYDELIVEYLWRSKDGENANVVTIFHNDNILAKNRDKFMNMSLDIFYDYQSFSQFVFFFDKKIIGFDFLFKVPVDLARIGVLDHWFSVGPVDLWKRGEAIPNQEDLRTKIASNPKLSPSILNYQSLAFIFNIGRNLKGPFHAIKAPCAKKTGNGWEADIDKIAGYLNNWLRLFKGI